MKGGTALSYTSTSFVNHGVGITLESDVASIFTEAEIVAENGTKASMTVMARCGNSRASSPEPVLSSAGYVSSVGAFFVVRGVVLHAVYILPLSPTGNKTAEIVFALTTVVHTNEGFTDMLVGIGAIAQYSHCALNHYSNVVKTCLRG